MRLAQAFTHMMAGDLEQRFPAILDAVGHLGHPPATGLGMMLELLQRHGASVDRVISHTLQKRPSHEYPEGSLFRLYGDAERDRFLPRIEIDLPQPDRSQVPLRIEIDPEREVVEIDGVVSLRRSAAARLMILLAQAWLEDAGAGRNPLDFTFMNADRLASDLGLSSSEAVRQSINRTRRDLHKKFASAGRAGEHGESIIENLPWQGYRLTPDSVTVRVKTPD